MMRIIQSIVSFLMLGCVTKNPQGLPQIDYTAQDTHSVARSIASDSSKKDSLNYLALDLPFTVFEKIRKSVESKEGIQLQHRGEAHITVLTPPEYQKIQKTVSMKEVNALASKLDLGHSPYKLLCVGKGSVTETNSGKKKSTYYVVVESNRLFEIRKAIQMLYVKKGGAAGDFNPEVFYPHVTLGFTERDLHYEDGVIKDASSCIFSLNAKNEIN